MNWQFVREVGWLRTLNRGTRRKVGNAMQGGNWLHLPSGFRLWLPQESAFGSEAFIAAPRVDWGAELILRVTHQRETQFVDAGANLGYYSALMADVAAHIHAFEPDPRAWGWLQLNIGSLSNTSLYRSALGSVAETGWLSQSAESAVSNLVSESGSGAIAVDVTTLDAALGDRSMPVGSIKTDCEGHDFAVLLGADTIIRDDRPTILTEQEPNSRLSAWASERSYCICAITRADVRRSFIVEPDQTDRVKMLFLIPEERRAEIVTEAGAQM